MKPWALYGITKRLTEKFAQTRKKYKKMGSIFNKSLYIFPIDVGNDSQLNYEIAAMMTPQYNIHRFGIFFSDTPRHADLLMILGKPVEPMVNVLYETITQLAEPFGVVILENNQQYGLDFEQLKIPNIAAHIKEEVDAEHIISILLSIMGRRV